IQYSYNFKDFLVNLSFLFTFSINFQTLLGYQNPVSSLAVGHFWSLGIEEQFYLLFAPILYLLRNHIWIVLLGFISTGFYFYYTHENFFVGFPNYSYYFTAHRFLFFGAGGALAFFLRYFSLSMIINYISSQLKNPKVSSVQLNSGLFSPSLLQKLLNRKSFIYVILGIQLYLLVQAMLYLFGIKFTSIESNFIIDILVALLIIVVAIADYSVLYILGLETKFFKYLGKISYGIYIFHVFSIFLAYNLLKNIGLKDSNTNLFYSVFLFLSLGISVGLATLSYHYFEIHFLKLKLKFQAAK
ncbi:MAG: acyltransferase, partial [Saprospiraceae bacterium]